jgi:hypothetical protein
VIVHHVGTPTADGVAWVSVAVRDDGTRSVVREEQEGLSPLRPPRFDGDAVVRIDAPGLVVRPEGFERTLAYWLGPGVTQRECHRAKVTDVRGGVPICFRGEEVAGDVRLAGTTDVGATLGAGAVFLLAVAALIVGGRWLARRARDEEREAYLRRLGE